MSLLKSRLALLTAFVVVGAAVGWILASDWGRTSNQDVSIERPVTAATEGSVKAQTAEKEPHDEAVAKGDNTGESRVPVEKTEPWMPKDWKPDPVQAEFLQTLYIYANLADEMAPRRARSLSRILRRHNLTPKLSVAELHRLQPLIQDNQREITECKRMLRSAKIACLQDAVRAGHYETIPPPRDASVSALKNLMAFLAGLRGRLRAKEEGDFEYMKTTTRNGPTIVYLARSNGHAAFFSVADQLSELQERRDRRIKAFLASVRPK